MSEGTLVGAHVIKMMGYIQTLEKQGFALNNELVTDVILQSLSDSFKQFILNFNMNDIDKTFPQLLGMLRIAKKVEGISQVVEENPTDLETQPLRRSTRERHEPERYEFLVTTHGDVILVDHDEPKTYQEAVASPDSEKWLEAMRSEMDSMSENQVWTLVEPPEGIKLIGCKWVFKKKTDMDGNEQTYKGRLVAKGFPQIHGVDYDETFSPVAMFKSIRILLAVAAFHDYEIWQMDVKTAFLNGKLEEDVYMTQPEGFVTPENARKGISLSKEMCPSTPQERERMSQIPYASAIGSIMYAMICTRPDLSYALSMTSVTGLES
ncbi:hypothetical protein V6N12_019249 [Hibiscus sabdariffa]|uniref:Reverse transcriptase Ty1/copia-type domain-containing protein n=1 Tax=Hibiscus sabdariffa TaxID=183260 RepID=A0ABR2C8X7_9ROSI